jgi:hypothetical protein
MSDGHAKEGSEALPGLNRPGRASLRVAVDKKLEILSITT